jgi:hypothetical protein
MEGIDEKPPSPIALRQGYEPPDLNVRGLLIFLVVFLVTAVVIHVGIWFLNEYLLRRPRPADAVTSAVPVVRQFPEPDVQPSEWHNHVPWQDMADLRRSEAARFGQLGWKADPATGSAVIPDSIVASLAERYKGKVPAAGAGNTTSATAPRVLPATEPATPAAPASEPATAPATAPTSSAGPTSEPTTNPGGEP